MVNIAAATGEEESGTESEGEGTVTREGSEMSGRTESARSSQSGTGTTTSQMQKGDK